MDAVLGVTFNAQENLEQQIDRSSILQDKRDIYYN